MRKLMRACKPFSFASDAGVMLIEFEIDAINLNTVLASHEFDITPMAVLYVRSDDRVTGRS